MAHSNFAVAKRSLTVSLAAGMVMAFTALVFAEPGNISPEKIKIDINANLTDDNVGIVDDGTIDWIRDNVVNQGTKCLAPVTPAPGITSRTLKAQAAPRPASRRQK